MINNEIPVTVPILEEDIGRLDPHTKDGQFSNTISLNGANAATVHIKRSAIYVWYEGNSIGY